MFELPEILTLADQLNQTIQGKIVSKGNLGNSPHKFVWYNRKPDEFAQLTLGKKVGNASVKGRWLFLPLEPGYIFVLGECGGKVLFHPDTNSLPAKYHLFLGFEDGSAVTIMTQMWGAMELYEAGQEQARQYIHQMRPTPVEEEFSLEYFNALIDELLQGEKRGVKSLLTQDQLVPGLGNAIAQDIMFKAGLHPKHALTDLDKASRERLFNAITSTVRDVTEKGGRYDETDLFGKPGGYQRLMDNRTAGQPCPVCGTTIQKMQYLGGACYICSTCQV
jgi:formamidopyrimidine-DNA glycosylase